METKNKGLQIRDNKRRKNNSKMRKVKDSQVGLCRYVDFKYMTFKRINGKTRPDKMVTDSGLQIGNKIYLADGKYKFVNNKSLHITKIYSELLVDAPEELKEVYNKKN